MSNLYVMEGVNLFCGDGDPAQASKALQIRTLQLPSLEEATTTHRPGGAVAAVELSMASLNPLAVSFNLAGVDPQLLSMFGLGQRTLQVFTAYGIIRDKRTSRAIEAKAIFQARLARIEQEEFQRGELMGADYGLVEVMHYESYFDGQEKHYFDFFTSAWRVDGVSQNADERRILRLS